MKAAMIVLPILIVLGLVGAAMTGAVDIPGITPAKKKVAKKEPEKKPDAESEPAPPIDKKAGADAAPVTVAKQEPEAPKPDEEKGQKKIAALWAEIQTEKLLAMIEPMKDAELAPILSRMDNEKVAKLLEGLLPKRAAELSKAIQKIAAAPPPQPES